MKYASGLLQDGKKLLHWLVHIFCFAFIVNLTLIWPVRYIWSDNNYQDSVKGKLCAKANLTTEAGSDVEFSLKPKLLVIMHACVFWGLLHFYFFSVLKVR